MVAISILTHSSIFQYPFLHVHNDHDHNDNFMFSCTPAIVYERLYPNFILHITI